MMKKEIWWKKIKSQQGKRWALTYSAELRWTFSISELLRWALMSSSEHLWALKTSTDLHLIPPSFVELLCAMLSFLELCWAMSSSGGLTQHIQAQESFTEFNQVSLRFYWPHQSSSVSLSHFTLCSVIVPWLLALRVAIFINA